jgi:hypothetical protein
VASCAGKYVAGAEGSNVCLAGSEPIVTEAACRTAAAAFGKNLSLSMNESGYPRRCSYIGSFSAGRVSYMYFNAHPVGNGRASFMPLCAADTTLPPTGAPRAQNAHALVSRHCALRNARVASHALARAHDRACAVCARRCGGVARGMSGGGLRRIDSCGACATEGAVVRTREFAAYAVRAGGPQPVGTR